MANLVPGRRFSSHGVGGEKQRRQAIAMNRSDTDPAGQACIPRYVGGRWEAGDPSRPRVRVVPRAKYLDARARPVDVGVGVRGARDTCVAWPATSARSPRHDVPEGGELRRQPRARPQVTAGAAIIACGTPGRLGPPAERPQQLRTPGPPSCTATDASGCRPGRDARAHAHARAAVPSLLSRPRAGRGGAARSRPGAAGDPSRYLRPAQSPPVTCDLQPRSLLLSPWTA